jgi:hypothetical protein
VAVGVGTTVTTISSVTAALHVPDASLEVIRRVAVPLLNDGAKLAVTVVPVVEDTPSVPVPEMRDQVPVVAAPCTVPERLIDAPWQMVKSLPAVIPLNVLTFRSRYLLELIGSVPQGFTAVTEKVFALAA